MGLGPKTLLAVMMSLAGSGLPMGQLKKFSDGQKSGQHPFNDEELEKLSSFPDDRAGVKAKKKYVKQLREKYAGQAKQ